MPIGPAYESSIKSNSQGEWMIDVPDSITPGLHRIIAEDQAGFTDEALLFIDREDNISEGSSTFLERFSVSTETTPLIPAEFALAIFFFFLIIIALSLNNIRLGRLIDQSTTIKKRISHTKKAMILATVAIIASFLMGLILNDSVGVFDRSSTKVEQEGFLLSIEGSIVRPFDNQPVAGVDLASGDTSIRVSESGKYTFNRISSLEGIRMTHPALMRAFRKSFDSLIEETNKSEQIFSATIYFDPDLYNVIAKAIDAESRKRFDRVYDLMLPEIQQTVSKDRFAFDSTSIFGVEDITSQEIIIDQIIPHQQWDSPLLQEPLPFVVEVIIKKDDLRQIYYVHLNENGWFLVR